MMASPTSGPPRTATHIRDREMTRAAILAAAEQEFARHGLESARTEEIAERSGVTKGMIYHYFGSKEKLYEAALEQVFAPLLISFQQFAAPETAPAEALEGIVRRILEVTARKPGVPAMLFFEIIQNRNAYYEKIGFPSLYHVLAAILERGCEQSIFKPLDAWHTAINIVGACCFYYCAAQRLQSVWPGNLRPLSSEMIAQHQEEALTLVMSGVRA
ncbi:MAG: TetR/AcrR family transcriptional regulator [Acidobacteriota bacterium]|nr:TetR/AcrR family transcriptional regulator [Acidobacteriota bacterium]